jgi:hypothetical protein
MISRYNFADIVQEVAERDKRKSDVIICGAAEQPANYIKHQRQEQDKAIVSDILKEIKPTIQTTDLNIQRLDHCSDTNVRPRPGRVILYSELEIRQHLLRNDEGAGRYKTGVSRLSNNQCARTITTLNTKTPNNKEKIHEFNFKAAKNKKFFDFKFKMSFKQEKFSVTKT